MLTTLLKHAFQKKHLRTLSTLTLTLSTLLIVFNCGKRKPPLPPVERVKQRVEISGAQRGNSVVITWEMPAQTSADKSLLSIKRADIYRIVELGNAPLTLSEDEFASSSTLIGAQPISNADFGNKRFTYVDELQFSGQFVRLRYAIRFVNAAGQKAAFSNFLIIEPNSKIAESPTNLKIELTEPFINLTWAVPQANVDKSSPANIIGYNVYRLSDSERPPKLLNSAPVTNAEFADSSFEFNKDYSYFVRAVSLGNNAQPVESLDSNTVRILPRDTFAPSAPAALTIAAAPNIISIFFALNPEKDILGYNAYRSSDPTLPKSDWLRITPTPLRTNTFEDTNIQSGKTYYYYLTAVDIAGNVSQPSNVVSETAP